MTLMSHFMNLTGYSRIVSELIIDRLPALGPGSPNSAMRPQLAALTVEQAFVGKQIANRDTARCCLSALWLWHDFLEPMGISVYRLAKETGVSHTTLWRLKKGKAQGITFDTLEKISATLKCQPGDVLKLGRNNNAGKKRR